MVSVKSGFDLFSLQSNIELLFRGFKIHLETVQVSMFMVKILFFKNNILSLIYYTLELTFFGRMKISFRNSEAINWIQISGSEIFNFKINKMSEKQ